MGHRPLQGYFENEGLQLRALSAVKREKWLEPGKNLDLYDLSRRAFDPAAGVAETFRSFAGIYTALNGPDWQVFRSNRKNAAHWTAPQVFETLDREFPAFAWRTGRDLTNFQSSPELDAAIREMRGIKDNRDYPLMTVSKFLHFYNPALFPIYDGAVIWERVFRRFRADFRDFCCEAGISYARALNDVTGDFLRIYMLWASSLLRGSHGRFMRVFADWIGSQPGADPDRRSFDVSCLYATAFEFTIIGAASDAE
jgi:hypothetical protein